MRAWKSPAPAFDPLTVLQAVAEKRCTALYRVPTQPRFAEFDLSSLRTGTMAGSPCPIEVMRRVQSPMNMLKDRVIRGGENIHPRSR